MKITDRFFISLLSMTGFLKLVWRPWRGRLFHPVACGRLFVLVFAALAEGSDSPFHDDDGDGGYGGGDGEAQGGADGGEEGARRRRV